MQRSIRLGIDTPCSESWDQMTPEKQGRFCGSCQKTVVDFTAMDDHQLLQWFAGHQGSVCGRLRPDQLDRPVAVPPEKKHSRYWHFLVAGLLFSAEASAQVKPDSIRCRVMDTKGAPVSYASVKYSTNEGVVTDPQGYFAIAAGKVSTQQTLTISAVGYETVQISANQLPAGEKRDIVLKESQGTLGDVIVIAGGVTRKKRKPLADTISLFKDTLAAIGLAKPALTAYPNPVARGGEITLKTRLDQQGKYNIQLLSTSGALITAKEVDGSKDPGNIGFPIPAGLVPGIYIVRLSALTRCYTQKIVVY